MLQNWRLNERYFIIIKGITQLGILWGKFLSLPELWWKSCSAFKFFLALTKSLKISKKLFTKYSKYSKFEFFKWRERKGKENLFSKQTAETEKRPRLSRVARRVPTLLLFPHTFLKTTLTETFQPDLKNGWKKCLDQLLGDRSTQKLVEIHNNQAEFDPPAQSHASNEARALPLSHHGWMPLDVYPKHVFPQSISEAVWR